MAILYNELIIVSFYPSLLFQKGDFSAIVLENAAIFRENIS